MAGAATIGAIDDQGHGAGSVVGDGRRDDHVACDDIVARIIAQRVDIQVSTHIHGSRRDSTVLDSDGGAVGGVSRDQAAAAQGENLAAQIQGGRSSDDEGERVDIAIGGQGRRADGADADVVSRGAVMNDSGVVARIASGAQAAHAHPGGIRGELGLEDSPAADETIGQRGRRSKEEARLLVDGAIDTNESKRRPAAIGPCHGGRGDVVLAEVGPRLSDIDDASPFL